MNSLLSPPTTPTLQASKGKKKKNRGANPTGLASMKDTANEMAAEATDAPELTGAELRKHLQKQFPVLSKLKTEDVEKLEEGCVALAAAFDTPEAVDLMPQIARCGVVEELCEVAAQSLASTKAKAAVGTPANSPQTGEAMAEAQLVVVSLGALRNMSLAGEEAVVEMVRAGVVQPLLRVLEHLVQTVQDPASKATGVPSVDNEALARAFGATEQAVSIAVSVVESSELGARQITFNKDFVELTAAALTHASCPLPARIAILQSYLTLTDSGGPGAGQVLAHAGLEAFFTECLQAEAANIHLRTLVAAVLCNLRGPTALQPAEAVMGTALSFDAVSVGAEILKILPPETDSDCEFKLRQKAPVQYDAWWSHVRAVQLAMEMLTDAVAGEEEEEEGVGCTQWDMYEDMEDEACLQAFGGQGSQAMASTVGTALLAEGSHTLANILARCTLAGAELGASPHSMAKEMCAALETIAVRGCALIGNLAPCIPPGSKALFLCWGAMRGLAYSANGGRGVAEAAVRGMATLLRHAKEAEALDFARVACDQELLGFLTQVARSPCREHAGEEAEGAVGGEAQEQAAAMCGILGELKHDSPLAEGAVAALAAALQSPSLGVSSEALNSVFDMFADDDDNDALFRKADVLAQLQAYQPTWKARVKQASQDRESPEAIDRAQEAVLNLKRFIQYKRKMGH